MKNNKVDVGQAKNMNNKSKIYIMVYKWMLDKWPSYLHFRRLNEVKNFFAKKCLRSWSGMINFGTHLRISTDVSVGIDVGFGDYTRINGPVEIGNHIMFGPNVAIYRSNHGMETDRPMSLQAMTRPICLIIEDDVWIGDGAIILPGCTKIGQGSIIGARAVVTHDVPKWSVVAGNPGKVVKSRM